MLTIVNKWNIILKWYLYTSISDVKVWIKSNKKKMNTFMWWKNLRIFIHQIKEKNLHVCQYLTLRCLATLLFMPATPGPQTRRHPVIPHSCAVRSDLGRCSIHHSPPFGHTIEVSAVCLGWCNKLVSKRSTLESSGKANVPCIPHPPSIQKIYCQIFGIQQTTTTLCI